MYRKKDICFTSLYDEANKRTKVVRIRRKAWKNVSTSRMGVVSLFWEGQIWNISGLRAIWSPCQLLSCLWSSCRQYIIEWSWLCSNKTLFPETGSQSMSHGLLMHDLRKRHYQKQKKENCLNVQWHINIFSYFCSICGI